MGERSETKREPGVVHGPGMNGVVGRLWSDLIS